MPIESTQHLYNLPVPQGLEEMRPYTNQKFIPAPLTDGLGRRPSRRPRLGQGEGSNSERLEDGMSYVHGPQHRRVAAGLILRHFPLFDLAMLLSQ